MREGKHCVTKQEVNRAIETKHHRQASITELVQKAGMEGSGDGRKETAQKGEGSWWRGTAGGDGDEAEGRIADGGGGGGREGSGGPDHRRGEEPDRAQLDRARRLGRQRRRRMMGWNEMI